MTDILRALKNPTHDPRHNIIGGPIFRDRIVKMNELKAQMKLAAQVVNVVDFGVFVDIGLGVSCLVHISQLSNRYMKDLHQHYCVGDRLNVWVERSRPGESAYSAYCRLPLKRPENRAILANDRHERI